MVKLGTQFISANNCNPLGKVVQWSKQLGKTDNNKCNFFANFAVSCGRHLRPQFSPVPSQINLPLIHILQNIVMEDFNFHHCHLSLFVVIKIMKQNYENVVFDCSRSGDWTATRYISPAHWLWGKCFVMLKISQTLFASA